MGCVKSKSAKKNDIPARQKIDMNELIDEMTQLAGLMTQLADDVENEIRANKR